MCQLHPTTYFFPSNHSTGIEKSSEIVSVTLFIFWNMKARGAGLETHSFWKHSTALTWQDRLQWQVSMLLKSLTFILQSKNTCNKAEIKSLFQQ